MNVKQHIIWPVALMLMGYASAPRLVYVVPQPAAPVDGLGFPAW